MIFMHSNLQYRLLEFIHLAYIYSKFKTYFAEN